ncbi:major capsid family protein [Desulfovibrio sp. 1214_IL3152]|uniref:major capsid family protein n=1 Tax=Desulfovibrio sp. 1214_IL3152 TaxID=3084056 RepID=UPI002FD97D8A
MSRYGNGPSYGSQGNVQAADIAFSIHTQVDSSFYDVEYPDYEWYGILDETQVMQDINAGATSYAYITRDKHGAAAFIGNGPNDNIPKVGQSAGAVQVPVAYAAVGAVITNEDARQYDFGFNGNLAQDLGEAMRKAADNLTETSVIFGNKSIGFQPWINYPGVTSVMVGAGAGGDTEWSTKTGIEMVRDVNAVLNAMWVNSRTIMKPLTVFIPLTQYTLLNETPIVIGNTGTAMTAMEYLKKNNIMTQLTGKELDIRPSRYLAGAGAGDTDRLVAMDRRRENQCMPFPLPYLLSQPIPAPLAAELYAEMKIGSFHVRQQGSMMYADGI